MSIRHRILGVLPALASTVVIASAVSWTSGAVSHVPVVSEIVGIAAIGIAPGLAAEALFHRPGWTLIERLGLASALSMALTSLVGIGLHLLDMAITPLSILYPLLAISGIGLVTSVGRTPHRSIRRVKGNRADVAVGVASLVLLCGAIASIVILRPGPVGPRIEVMVVDDRGDLATMPIISSGEGATVEVLIRSAVPQTTVQLTLDGSDVVHWSSGRLLAGSEWVGVHVPLELNRDGRISAQLRVNSTVGQLSLPLLIEGAP